MPLLSFNRINSNSVQRGLISIVFWSCIVAWPGVVTDISLAKSKQAEISVALRGEDIDLITDSLYVSV